MTTEKDQKRVEITEEERGNLSNIRTYKGIISSITPIVSDSKIISWEVIFSDGDGAICIFLNGYEVSRFTWFIGREVQVDVWASDTITIKDVKDISETYNRKE